MEKHGGFNLTTKLLGAALLILFCLPGLSMGQSLEEAARLNKQVVQLYRQGRYQEAIAPAKRSLAIDEKALGPDHPRVATNLNNPQLVLRCYRRRMWIEEMFGDLKGHGVDIESTHLRHFLRLSRLTLAVVMLYFWLVAFGSQTIKSGERRLVDRNDRRDYSIFRIGSNTVERRLVNNLSLQVSFDFSL